jgi:glycosyltransferase involved in cell wall biosynthesis
VELYLAADVNVVTFMHEPLFYENSPNKFFDGIAAGLPAVFNRTTWLEPWLERYGCGIVCTSDDAGAEMACQLKRLAADGERRRRMGQGARRLAEEVFSRDQLAAEYLAVLAGAVGSGRCGRIRLNNPSPPCQPAICTEKNG